MMNPNLALFAQMANRPQMPPQMMAPQGMSPQAMTPRPQAPQQPRLTPQEMAAMGRFGDRIVAHLTPGEIEVPPQVQTPKVLATLKKAFQHKGVQPQQFTAGSPTSSVNPKTGAPEYNLFASLLPIAGTVAGAAFGGPFGAAAGGALGGALGGEMNGGGTSGALSGALMGGVGGYFGGTALGGAFPETFGTGPLQGPMTSGATLDTATPPAGSSGLSGAWNALKANPLALMGGVGALSGLLGGLGSNGTNPNNTYRPPGFNDRLSPMNQLGTPNQQLGVGTVPQRTIMAPSNPGAYGYGPGQQLVY